MDRLYWNIGLKYDVLGHELNAFFDGQLMVNNLQQFDIFETWYCVHTPFYVEIQYYFNYVGYILVPILLYNVKSTWIVSVIL